ncbi:hypothetical protein Lal_00026652, partial [Lupinus albus]
MVSPLKGPRERAEMTESECPNREGGAQEVGISFHVGFSVARSSKCMSLRSTPASVHPPETTNLDPSIVQELCHDLGSGGVPPQISKFTLELYTFLETSSNLRYNNRIHQRVPPLSTKIPI